ncbi:MAG: oligosaccharide flippase family protein [Chloroflexota bacterium]
MEPIEAEGIPRRSERGASRLLARNAIGGLALNLANVAITTVTTILLAQMMGAAGFGVYSFVIATVTLLGIPAVLGIDRLVIRDIAVYSSTAVYGLAHGLLLRAQQMVLILSVVLALGTVVAAWIVAGGTPSTGLIAFWLGVVGLPFLALGRIVQGGLMGLHDILLGQAPEYILRPAVLLALVVVVAAAGAAIDPAGAVFFYSLSIAVACLVSVALLWVRTPREVREARPAYATRPWLMSAISLGFLSGSSVLNSQIGVALLGAMSGSEAAGLYAVAQRGALLVAFPLAAVSAAIGPMAARLWAAGERQQLQHLVTLGARGALLAALPLAFAYLAAGRQILDLFFGGEFAGANAALAILTVGQLVNAATGTVATLLVMTGHQRRAALAITAGALINLTVSGVLIPTLDTVGAALGAVASLTLANVVLVIIAYRTLGIQSIAFGPGAFRRRPT